MRWTALMVALALAAGPAYATKKEKKKKGGGGKPHASESTSKPAPGKQFECTDISGHAVPAKAEKDCKAPSQWLEVPPGMKKGG